MVKKSTQTKPVKRVIVLLVTITIILNYIYGSVADVDSASKKMSLYIKITHYARTNQTKELKKTQTIRIKNLSSKNKVKWQSSNQKIAFVKAKKNGEAVLKVSLERAGTVKIKATIKTKKKNKKVVTFTKTIRITNKSKRTKPAATVPPTLAPILKPTDNPMNTPTPTPTKGDNLVTLPPDSPTATPPNISTAAPTATPPNTSTAEPTDSPMATPTGTPTAGPTLPPTPTKNPDDEGWTGWH